MKSGVHVSISGGFEKAIERAESVCCASMQIFTSSPRGWRQRIIEDKEAAYFKKALKNTVISPVIAHTPYLINLSTGNSELWENSVAAVTTTLINSHKLGLRYVVTHVGGDTDLPDEKRLDNLSAALFKIFETTGTGNGMPILLLENGAGAPSSTLSKLENFAKLFEMTKGLTVDCCLDTCHLFAAGYDISSGSKFKSFIKQVEDNFGTDRVKAFHLNDAKGGLGSGLDRHEHIGMGKIGLDAFREIATNPIFADVPGILETPKKSPDDDARNMQVISDLTNLKL